MVTFKEFFSFKNNRFFWLNLIAMVVVIVAASLGNPSMAGQLYTPRRSSGSARCKRNESADRRK